MDKSSSPLGPVAPLVTPKMDNLPQKNEIVVYQPDETLRDCDAPRGVRARGRVQHPATRGRRGASR